MDLDDEDNHSISQNKYKSNNLDKTNSEDSVSFFDFEGGSEEEHETTNIRSEG